MQTFPVPTVYEALNLVMKNFPDNISQETRVEVETLLDHCLDGLSACSEKFLTTLFIKAIRKHIGPSGTDEHIYLKKFEVPQIELFNLLIEQFPFVKKCHEIINDTILEVVGDASNIVIIDIGTGMGVQMNSLLKKLSASKTLRRVTLIGIEPFSEALDHAQSVISKVSCSFALNFIPVRSFIEEVDFEWIGVMIQRSGGDLVINESLALHHIKQQTDRHRVIKKLRGLNPKAFFLTEPNVDHYEPDFQRRFQNCYQHFYHVFQVIDQLPVDEVKRNGLKLFFGREIDDIIGGNEMDRVEKHEPAFRWIEKLLVNGFKPLNRFSKGAFNLGYGIKPEFDDFSGSLGLRFKNETVISLIHAVCDDEFLLD
ncbi:GRAS family protein [Natronoflexus pectinivorans]|uniref:GRAS domain family protein n=1 Tax=Natronoflexus pectinivorans TaxID=682526 RepID=A0A4R2GF76_9BACT|nr:GRAS family protein [Natronoflexus pectinivorans]TCO06817.1 GRAS domain family protein [Natronoflexus pectinivorans]